MADGIELKTRGELQAMRQSGLILARALEAAQGEIRPGATTRQVDAVAAQVISDAGAVSNFLGYHGFPAVICASPNDVIVHGIPGPYRLQEGDIISIDCGAIVDGWHGDAAFTAGVGTITPEARRLIEVAESALDAAIAELVAGHRLGDVGYAVESTAHAAGLGVVEGYTGHAIGQAMHEPPNVANQGTPGQGAKLRVGNVLAVEPMVVLGDIATDIGDDGWTVVTVDGSWSAHAEHTIAITSNGPEILTLP